MDEHIVLLSSETLHADELYEVHQFYVYASWHSLPDRRLATCLWSHEAHAFGKDGLFGARVNFLNWSSCVDRMHFTKLFVVVNDWLWVLEEVVYSAFHGLGIIISPSTSFSSLHTSGHHGLLRYFVVQDRVGFQHVWLKEGGLINSTREAINQVCMRRVLYQPFDK